MAAGSGQAVHIGFHEKLQSSFRQGAQKIAAVGLLHQLDSCHAVLGHRGLLWLQVRLRNFTLQPTHPMATSPIPSRLDVSPPAWTTPEFTPPPWTLPHEIGSTPNLLPIRQ